MDVSDSIAWQYHQHTNHTVERLRLGGHTLDWPNQPRPYKRYLDPLESVQLPEDWSGTSSEMDAALLAKLLQLSAGITKHVRFPGGTMAFRAAACTGALYHIDVYAICTELPGIPAGVYHFDVERRALSRLRRGDFRQHLAQAAGGDDAIAQAPVTLAMSSTWWRNAWKYQARAYRHAYWDSGTILANLLAVAAAHQVPAGIVLGFVDASINALLGLDGIDEAALELVPLGREASQAPVPPPVEPLAWRIERYSPRELRYRLIQLAHEATALSTPEEAAAWRGASRENGNAAAPVPGAADGETIERVIRRRGSAREFASAGISSEQLEVLLGAVDPPPGDWGAPTGRLYLIVNAVEGIEAGGYAFDGKDGSLRLLRRGDHRDYARHLDLDQDLAGDAAVNFYFLADLNAVLERLGERGYRTAQLEASIMAGRLYLTAYANGLAATGLTFFDDEVVDFFSPDAAGQSVMFLLAVGHRAGRTR